MKYLAMDKRQLLAAETFSYSYANYADHLGVNERFDKLMPRKIDVLEKAEQESWDHARLAKELNLSEDQVKEFLVAYAEAKDIVLAKNAAESFRRGVKYSILLALETGLSSPQDIDKLAGQICYRAADLAYLLDMEGKQLSDYSEELRGWDGE